MTKEDKELLSMFEGLDDHDLVSLLEVEAERRHYNPHNERPPHPYSIREIKGEVLRRMRKAE